MLSSVDHLFVRPLSMDPAIFEEVDMIGDLDRMVNVMKYADDRFSMGVPQVANGARKLPLESPDPSRDRFIQKDDRGVLGKRHGDPNPLLLAAWLVHRPRHIIFQIHVGEGPFDLLLVLHREIQPLR